MAEVDYSKTSCNQHCQNTTLKQCNQNDQEKNLKNLLRMTAIRKVLLECLRLKQEMKSNPTDVRWYKQLCSR